MVEELTWILLSKRRENVRLAFFYRSIHFGHGAPFMLNKVDRCTWKECSMMLRQIGYKVNPYEQSFLPKVLRRGMSFLKKKRRAQHF